MDLHAQLCALTECRVTITESGLFLDIIVYYKLGVRSGACIIHLPGLAASAL